MSGVKIGLDTDEEAVFVTLRSDSGLDCTIFITPELAYMLSAQLRTSALALNDYFEENRRK